MDLRFGMFAVDPVTKARTERPIATAYREVIATGAP